MFFLVAKCEDSNDSNVYVMRSAGSHPTVEACSLYSRFRHGSFELFFLRTVVGGVRPFPSQYTISGRPRRYVGQKASKVATKESPAVDKSRGFRRIVAATT